MPTVVSQDAGTDRSRIMTIGVDPHKSSHTATAVDVELPWDRGGFRYAVKAVLAVLTSS
jgi:hypothetical protein